MYYNLVHTEYTLRALDFLDSGVGFVLLFTI